MQDRKHAYQEFLKSDFWAQISSDCKERDENRCRVCNSTKLIAAHHRRYPDPWTSTTLADLTTLCKDCHELFHKKTYAHFSAKKKASTETTGKIQLTRNLIRAATNHYFALNKAQMAFLNLKHQPKLKYLLRRRISLADYEQLKALNRFA